ncbi:zinc-binding alcohol dehydrogenase family protein [Enterococcus dongliensis]|uniref:zinc-binding alcohol dehydrogenase family protein n=1 Tax=Enterococcus dongliensis TaxID=2559925 RepID=UPI0028925C28|nr:zinc-binding alcohol dehydrogenase family protein [Enterococcus dongliensis]MDT2612308.1 zinc-binding alcohol dehydrogenase family protein [Enterococcus dongliensis]
MISRVIGFEKGFPLSNGNQFEAYEVMLPKVNKFDLIVKNLAVSINPIDTKLRQSGKGIPQPHVLGFDSVGIVTQMGSKVENIQIGDRILFAGTTKRFGSYSECQVVDSRIVAKLPNEITTDEAAALPLTFITAFEMLFEKMGLIAEENQNDGEILIINGAGGVGSIATQLAKWAGLTVIATASREESKDWAKKMGADYVIDHHKNLTKQVNKLGYRLLPNILILHSTDHYFDEMCDLLEPFGHLGSIVGSNKDLNLAKLKNKSGSFDWEYMFAKTDYDFAIASQGTILELLVRLLQEKKIQSTLTKILPGFSPDVFYQAHQFIEEDKMIGKLVIHY